MVADQAKTEQSTPIVETRQLNARFGRQHVLRDVSLAIQPQQTVAVVGESGCGKTVLLKNLVYLLRPTSGRVLVHGRELSSLSERKLTAERRRMGFVFQNSALLDSLTVGQNVAFPLRQHGRPSDSEVKDRVLEKMAEVGLPEEVAAKRPAELSGGMRKRVALARALIMEPELILYDEPTTGLDPIMEDIINSLIERTMQNRQATSIVVTHNLRTVRRVADRVIMLSPLTRVGDDESQILFDGTPQEFENSTDLRVRQFARGEAGDRLLEMVRERRHLDQDVST